MQIVDDSFSPVPPKEVLATSTDSSKDVLQSLKDIYELCSAKRQYLKIIVIIIIENTNTQNLLRI